MGKNTLNPLFDLIHVHMQILSFSLNEGSKTFSFCLGKLIGILCLFYKKHIIKIITHKFLFQFVQIFKILEK